MSSEATISISQILWFLGALITISTVYTMWKKYVLKRNKEEEAIESLEKNNEMIMATLLALVNHSIDGNGIDGLKAVRTDLEKYLVKK